MGASSNEHFAVRNLEFPLHSVVVHHGESIHGGHYTAVVRSDDKEQWLLFDDDKKVESFSSLTDAIG